MAKESENDNATNVIDVYRNVKKVAEKKSLEISYSKKDKSYSSKSKLQNYRDKAFKINHI